MRNQHPPAYLIKIKDHTIYAKVHIFILCNFSEVPSKFLLCNLIFQKNFCNFLLLKAKEFAFGREVHIGYEIIFDLLEVL